MSLERMAVGALLRYPDLTETCGLTAEDFENDEERAIFSSIGEAERDSKGFAFVPSVSVLSNVPEGVLLDYPYAPNLEAAKDRVRSLRQTRLHGSVGLKLKRLAARKADGDRPGTRLIESTIAALEELRSTEREASLPTMYEVIEEYVVDKRRNGAGATAIPTGLDQLDNYIGCVHPGELLTVCSRPGEGKTTFALQLAMEWADLGLTGIYFSAEMSAHDLGEKLAYSLSRTATFTGALAMEQAEAALKVAEDRKWGLDRIKLADVSSLTVRRIGAALRSEVERGAGFFVVDNLKHVDTHTPEKDHERLARVTREIRALAKDMKIPCVALHHLSRRAEYAEEDESPQMGWIKGSGGIEEESDIVLFLEGKPNDAFAGMNIHGVGAIWVIKARRVGSRSVKIDLIFTKETQTFSERRTSL